MFKKAVKSLVFLLGIVICVVPSSSWAGWGDPNFIDFDTFSMEGYSNADIIPSFFDLDLGVAKVEKTSLRYLPIMDDDNSCFIKTAEAHMVHSTTINPFTLDAAQRIKIIEKTKELDDREWQLVKDAVQLLSSVNPAIQEAATSRGLMFRTGNIESIMEKDLGDEPRDTLTYNPFDNSGMGFTTNKVRAYQEMHVFTLPDNESITIILDESLFAQESYEALLVALEHELGGNVTLIQQGVHLVAPYSENADLCRAYMEYSSFQQSKETLDKLLDHTPRNKYLLVGEAKIKRSGLSDLLGREKSGFYHWKGRFFGLKKEHEAAHNPRKSVCFIDSAQDVDAAAKNAVDTSAAVREFLAQVEDIKLGRLMAYRNYDVVEKVYRLAEELNEKADSTDKKFLEGKKELSRILQSLGDIQRDVKSDFSKAIEWYEKASRLASSGYESGKIEIDIMRCYQELAKEAEGKGQFEQARSFLNKVVIKYDFGLRGSLILLSMDEDMAIMAAQESDRDIPPAYRGKGEEELYYIRKMELVGDGNFELGQSMYYLGAYDYAKVLAAFTEVEKILTDSEHTYYMPWSYDEYEINLFKCLCYAKLGRDDEAFAELKKISSDIGLHTEYKDAWKEQIKDRFYRETDIAIIGKYVDKYRLERELPDEYLMRESKGY